MRTSHCPVVGPRPEGMSDSDVYYEVQRWLGELYKVRNEVAERLEAEMRSIVNMTARTTSKQMDTQDHAWCDAHSVARLGIDQIVLGFDLISKGTHNMLRTIQLEERGEYELCATCKGDKSYRGPKSNNYACPQCGGRGVTIVRRQGGAA